MKKLLLSLCAAVFALSASAAEYTIEFVKGKNNNGTAFTTTTSLDKVISSGAEYVTGIASAENASAGINGLKLGVSAKDKTGKLVMNLAPDAQVQPLEISMKISANKNAKSMVFAFNGKEYAIENLLADFQTLSISDYEGTLEQLNFERRVSTADGWINIESITVTYGEAPVVAVPAPVLSLVQTEWGEAVEMTCEDPDAKIYYTTDYDMEDDPAQGYLYEEPVDVYVNTTFKAIAIKGDEKSKVTTFVAEPTMKLEDFSMLFDLDEQVIGTGLKVEFSGDMRAVYQSGAYTFVRSGYNNMMVYDYNQPKLNNGDSFTSLSGVFKLYNGQPEITAPVYGEITPATAGSVVNPTPVELDMINGGMLYQYVKVANVEIVDNTLKADVDGETFTVALYDQFKQFVNASTKATEYPTGTGLTVTGFVGKYKENLQLWPIEIEGGKVMEQVAAPVFNPFGGELDAGATITLTCATEGANIYYTTDGSEPSADATFYAAPIVFSEAMTVKAIAIADGMLDSKVVSASFTLRDPNAPEDQEATFNFTDLESLSVSFSDDEMVDDENNEGNKSIFVTGKEFNNSVVSVAIESSAEPTNPPRLYYSVSSENWSLRLYADSKITVSVPAGYTLEQIDFTGSSLANLKNNASPSNGTYNSPVWTPASGTVNSVTFAPAKSTTIKTMKVTYKSTSGVADAAVDADAAVEYYNLQGVRIQGELTPGLYIRRQGAETSKVIIR